jgi:hypothetical protein
VDVSLHKDYIGNDTITSYNTASLEQVPVVFFANSINAFPKVNRIGDILRLHRVKCQTYDKANVTQYQLVGSQNKSSFVTFSKRICIDNYAPISIPNTLNNTVEYAKQGRAIFKTMSNAIPNEPNAQTTSSDDSVNEANQLYLKLYQNWEFVSASPTFSFLNSDLCLLDVLYNFSLKYLASNADLHSSNTNNNLSLKELHSICESAAFQHVSSSNLSITNGVDYTLTPLPIPNGKFLDTVALVLTIKKENNKNVIYLWDGSFISNYIINDKSNSLPDDTLMVHSLSPDIIPTIEQCIQLTNDFIQTTTKFFSNNNNNDNLSLESLRHNFFNFVAHIDHNSSTAAVPSGEVAWMGEFMRIPLDEMEFKLNIDHLTTGTWIRLRSLKMYNMERRSREGTTVNSCFVAVGSESSLNVLPPYHR